MNTNGSRPYLRSRELARRSGVSTDTLRHYERKGLIRAGRSANGYREYPPGAEGQVQTIRHALSVGFTLDELARIIRIRDAGGAPCKEVRALASEKLQAVQEQIRALTTLRSELRELLERWDRTLARTRHGKQARLLDMLTTSAAGSPVAVTKRVRMHGQAALSLRSGASRVSP